MPGDLDAGLAIDEARDAEVARRGRGRRRRRAADQRGREVLGGARAPRAELGIDHVDASRGRTRSRSCCAPRSHRAAPRGRARASSSSCSRRPTAVDSSCTRARASTCPRAAPRHRGRRRSAVRAAVATSVSSSGAGVASGSGRVRRSASSVAHSGSAARRRPDDSVPPSARSTWTDADVDATAIEHDQIAFAPAATLTRDRRRRRGHVTLDALAHEREVAIQRDVVRRRERRPGGERDRRMRRAEPRDARQRHQL